MAGLAVHLVAALTEGAFLQLAQAVGTDEVLRVVLAPCGCDAAAGDRAAAAVADAALLLVEVQLTVGPTLQLKEGTAGEAVQALLGEGDGEGWHSLGGMLAPASPPACRPLTAQTKHSGCQTPCRADR